jgi:hypothetical protein
MCGYSWGFAILADYNLVPEIVASYTVTGIQDSKVIRDALLLFVVNDHYRLCHGTNMSHHDWFPTLLNNELPISFAMLL